MTQTGRVIMGLALRSALAILLAYSLGYGLVCALPDVGAGLLGINAADSELVADFLRNAQVPENYLDALTRFSNLHFGVTLDRLDVLTEVGRALCFSLPLYLVSICFVCCGALAGILAGGKEERNLDWWLTLGAFFPAYVPAFVVAGVAPGISGWAALQSPSGTIFTGFVVGFGPAILAANLCRASLNEIVREPYALLLEIYGYGKYQKLALLVPTVLRQVMPSMAKIATSVMVIQIFVESTFGLPGIGMSLIHAMQRSDVNLLLAYIALLSSATIVLGVSFRVGMYTLRAGRGRV